MGGRWDATNVADGAVAVVTNVGLDHAEVIGPTLADIATEKSGIIKPGSVVVLGEQSPSLRGIFEARHSAGVWHRGVEFACERNDAAVGGRVIDVRTPSGTLADLYLPLHGPHQGINATVAVTACEAFFGRVLDPSVVTDALAGVAVPGRFEVLRRQPLVVLDGAHNVDGARALTATLDDEFAGRVPDVLVVGFTSGRDPAEMLSILRASLAREVIACTPPHPRGIAAAAVAEAVDFPVGVAPSVPAAVARAMESAGDNDFVLVTGSLYVVGDARTALRR
jgi:dihydrofolate synthase/folylpolyglutamate synthase